MSKLLVTLLLLLSYSLNANTIKTNELYCKQNCENKVISKSSCKPKKQPVKKAKKSKKKKVKEEEIKSCEPVERIVYLYGDNDNFTLPKKEVEINNLLWSEPYSVIPFLHANEVAGKESWFIPQSQYYFITKPTHASYSNVSIQQTPIPLPLFLMSSAFIYFFVGRYFCNRKNKDANPYV